MDIIDIIKNIKDPNVLKEILTTAKTVKKDIGPVRVEKVNASLKIAEELKDFTNSIVSAKEAYIAKGFNVEVKTNKNGLITKWSIKRGKNPSPQQGMSDEDFSKALERLGDKEFSSKDLQNALIGSGIGSRKLQPKLTLLLNKKDSAIEKVPGTDKAGTLYRKVK
jgi:hypothetical protein